MSDDFKNYLVGIWHINLLGTLLNIYIVLVSILAMLYFGVGLFSISVSPQPFLIKLGMGVLFSAGVVLGYAYLRFLPDLIRIFDYIERYSRSGATAERSGRYIFLRILFHAFRLAAVLVPLNLLVFSLPMVFEGVAALPGVNSMEIRKVLAEAPEVPGMAALWKGGSLFNFLIMGAYPLLKHICWLSIFALIGRTLARRSIRYEEYFLGKPYTLSGALDAQYTFFCYLASAAAVLGIALPLPGLEALTVVPFLAAFHRYYHMSERPDAVMIEPSRRLGKHQPYMVHAGTMALLLMAYLRSGSFLPGLYFARWGLGGVIAYLDLAGFALMIYWVAETMRADFDSPVPKIAAGIVAGAIAFGSVTPALGVALAELRVALYLAVDEYARSLNIALAQLGNYGQPWHVRIGVMAVVLFFISLTYWITADFLLILRNIERNFRGRTLVTPPKKSVQYFLFQAVKYLTWITAAVTAVYVLKIFDQARPSPVAIVNPQSLNDAVRMLSEAGLSFLGSMASPRMAAVYFLQVFLLAGFMGDVVSLTHDIESYTFRWKEKQDRRFFALRWFGRIYHALGILVLLTLLGAALFAGRFAAPLAEALQLRHADLGQLKTLIVIASVSLGLFLYLGFSFISNVGSKLLDIESSLGGGRRYEAMSSFFGVRVFSWVMKILAYAGSLLVVVATIVLVLAKASADFRWLVLLPPAILLGVLVYIISAAIPDLCQCLLAIVTHAEHTHFPLAPVEYEARRGLGGRINTGLASLIGKSYQVEPEPPVLGLDEDEEELIRKRGAEERELNARMTRYYGHIGANELEEEKAEREAAPNPLADLEKKIGTIRRQHRFVSMQSGLAMGVVSLVALVASFYFSGLGPVTVTASDAKGAAIELRSKLSGEVAWSREIHEAGDIEMKLSSYGANYRDYELVLSLDGHCYRQKALDPDNAIAFKEKPEPLDKGVLGPYMEAYRSAWGHDMEIACKCERGLNPMPRNCMTDLGGDGVIEYFLSSPDGKGFILVTAQGGGKTLARVCALGERPALSDENGDGYMDLVFPGGTVCEWDGAAYTCPRPGLVLDGSADSCEDLVNP